MSNSMHALAIPKWGIEMENGTVSEWHREVGDLVTKGDDLVDLESDKIINTLEATATGVLRRQFAEVDDTLNVGELIGVIADADVSDEDIDAFVAEFNAASGDDAQATPATPATPAATPATPATPEAVSAPVASQATPTTAPAAASSGKVRVSPPVRRKAEKLGIDLSTITGSGPGGRITSDDVDMAAKGGADAVPAAQKAEADTFTTTKLTATQQTISSRLVESKQSIPHFYLSIDIELDGLLAKRKSINSDASQKVSINDMIVWCTARALMAVPQINAQLVGNEIRQFTQADISVAVATERGLLTPVLKAVDTLTPVEVASAIKELAEKAKSSSLQRSEIEGGSFTVSNLGMFGVKSFDAIINPPQVAILALGRAEKQTVVRDDDTTEIATVISANLSSDHRVVDGALGGTFLSALKQEIESLA